MMSLLYYICCISMLDELDGEEICLESICLYQILQKCRMITFFVGFPLGGFCATSMLIEVIGNLNMRSIDEEEKTMEVLPLVRHLQDNWEASVPPIVFCNNQRLTPKVLFGMLRLPALASMTGRTLKIFSAADRGMFIYRVQIGG